MRTIFTFCITILLLVTPPAISHAEEPVPPQSEWTTLVAENAAEETAERQPIEETGEPELLEPVIVTATSIETPVSRVGSSVTVITREQLEQLKSNSVLEGLRQVPGLNIVQTGGRGGVVDFLMRGGRPDFTLIMVDGVKLTDQSGRADLAHLTIDNIERIEIVRGPQSALYGADALSGVVNIITKKGSGPPRVDVTLQGGNLDNNLESASLSGSTEEGFYYSFSGSHYGAENNKDISNDRYDNYVFSGRAGFEIEDEVDLSFILRYQKAEVENPGPTQFLPEDPDDELDSRDIVFTTMFDQNFNEWWSHSFQAAYSEQSLNAEDPFAQDLFNDAAFTNDTIFERYSVNYKHDLTLFSDHVLTVGTDWEQEEADIESVDAFLGTTVIDEQRRNLGFFVQAALSFYDRLDIVFGVRHDDNSVFGSEVSPRFTASYHLKETGTRFKGSYGVGIKNPNFLDLFFSSPPFFFANPDLGPEESEAWDIGIEQSLLDGRVVAGITYFHTDYDNLISTVQTGPGVFSLDNLDEAESEGFEVEVTAYLPYHLTLNAAYTFTQAEDGDGNDLTRVPKHLLSVNLNYSHQRLMLNMDALIVSERKDINFAFVDNDGDFINDITDDEGNGYVSLNVSGEYKLNENFSLVGRVENLLDDERFEQALGFENPGINFMAGVRGVF